MLDLQLIGPFRLAGPDGEIRLTARKQIALLAFLATTAPRRQPRDRLIALFWGGQNEPQARQSLRQAVSKLRGRVGADVIVSADGAYGVAPDRMRCDLWRLQDSVRAPDPDLSDLPYGEFLEGLSLQDDAADRWLDEERQRARDMIADRLRDVGAEHAAAGQFDAAANIAEKALGADALRDDLQRLYMRALAASGRRAEALRAYDRFRRGMAAELESEPDLETRKLADDIRLGRPLDHDAASHPEVAGGRQPPMLAVLPFRPIDDDDEALANAGRKLAAAVIMELSSNPVFRVIDQASAFSDTLARANPVEAGALLGADLVATGIVRRVSTGGVRIGLALHQAGRSDPIWTDRFDGDGRAAAGLMENLLSRLCAAIGVRIERSMIEAAHTRHGRDGGAMEHFLRGLDAHHKHRANEFHAARAHFQAALAADPEFGRASAALAVTYIREWFWDSARTDLLDLAEQCARTALGLSPHDAWTQSVWGVVALYRRRHHDAELSFKRALELAPFDAYVVSRAALGKLYAGDFAEAESLFRQSIELDPLNGERQHGMLGHTLFHLGRYEDAIEALQNIDEPLVWELAWLAAAFAMNGDVEMAADAAEKCRSGSEGRYWVEMRPFKRDADLRRLQKGLSAAGLSP